MHDPNHWPDGSIRSTGNAFTHGYQDPERGGRPHGFVPGTTARPDKVHKKRRPGGFAKNHGTIAGGLKKARA